MGFRRRAGLGMPLLVLAGCLAAASARAVPITVYDHVELGADPAAAREGSGGVRGDAGATADIALDLVAQKTDLSIAPLEISLHRWDESLIGMLNGASSAPVDPNDPGALTQALANP